jgi:hypothetical protein
VGVVWGVSGSQKLLIFFGQHHAMEHLGPYTFMDFDCSCHSKLMIFR